MLWIPIAVSTLALVGHLALWIATFNRLHAMGWRRGVIDLWEKPVLLCLLGVPAAVLYWIGSSLDIAADPLSALLRNPLARVYFWLCCGVAMLVIAVWMARALRREPAQWVGYKREFVNVRRQLGHRPCGDVVARCLVRVPGNQIFDLEVNEKVFQLPRLPAALEGLSIAHLSDLHFTGRLSREFYLCAVEQVNDMHADLVALTGDLVDKVQCLPWIVDVLGRLRSRFGTYCILGNHDLRIRDAARIRGHLAEAGLQYVGGRWTEVRVHGHSLVLAGNECPWFRPAADLRSAPVLSPTGRPLRILLAHSPDVIDWARRRDVDLMLAGHTHGGQIRFPVVGPIVSPSLYGVRFASGVFFLRPTLLHVSRGLSGEQALRLNCRPELTKLVLHSSEPVAVSARTPAAVAAAFALPQHSRCCAEV
jgi:uncharacterized protein